MINQICVLPDDDFIEIDEVTIKYRGHYEKNT
jgi:hypothetical protein